MKNLVITLIVCLLCSVNVFAEEVTFVDVPIDSPYYESVEYIVKKGITKGYGNGLYCPEKEITLNEFATMLVRAYDDYQGAGPLATAYHNGWIDMNVVSQDPNKPICLGAVYKSALIAKEINVYSFDGYRPDWPEYVYTISEWGLCDKDVDLAQGITRGEVAELFYYLDNCDCSVKEPEILDKIKIENTTGKNMGDYALQLEKIPTVIIEKFNDLGWKFKVDNKEIWRYNEENGVIAIGLCSYAEKTIYVNQPSAVTHEFGHFLDYVSDGDIGLSHLYSLESDLLLKSNNSVEYFAESFVFYLANNEKFKETCPKTFEYFENLEKNNWKVK